MFYSGFMIRKRKYSKTCLLFKEPKATDFGLTVLKLLLGNMSGVHMFASYIIFIKREISHSPNPKYSIYTIMAFLFH